MNFDSVHLQALVQSDIGFVPPFLTSDMTIAQARKCWLVNSLLKKWMPDDRKEQGRLALDLFFESNEKCLTSFDKDIESDSFMDLVLSQTRVLLDSYVNSGPYQTSVCTLDDIVQLGMAGPGASVGTRETSFYRKMFHGPMTMTTSALYKHYCSMISPRWLAAELKRSDNFSTRIVKGSNLSSVPKNEKIDRTICTEPTLNMFYQKGLGKILERLLKTNHNIDLSTQPDVNRSMAKSGSIDGNFCTIDLKSASDTIAMRLVEFLFPDNFVSTLKLLRSPAVRSGGTYHELHMVSSMGNGFTFPLQTLIFATLVRAVYMTSGMKITRDGKYQYSVFGDDIIVHRSVYHTVLKVLKYCGFTVNEDKSFATGDFRESCGADFFKGHNIRGVYLKEVKNETHVFSAFNRLLRWSVLSGCPIPGSLRYLKGLVDFRPVPFDAGDSEGFKFPFAQAGLRANRFGLVRYRALMPVSKVFKVREAGFAYNPDGAIIATIGGYLRDGTFTPRLLEAKTFKVARRSTPRWDWIPPAGAGEEASQPTILLRDYEFMIALSKLE